MQYAFWGTRFSAFILSDFSPSLFISFIQCLAVSSTSNQPQQHQLKTTSTSLLRSSPGMGLGGVNIKTSGPPIRIGLSRNVRVKPLHAHVSVQHWIILSYASLHLVICILRTLHRHFFHQKVKGSKDTLNWPVWGKNFLLTMCGHILQINSILVCSGLCADVPPSSSNIPEATYHFVHYQLSSRTKNKLFLLFHFHKEMIRCFCNFYCLSHCKGIQESFSLKTLLSEQSTGIKRPLNVTSWVRGIRFWKANDMLFSGNL